MVLVLVVVILVVVEGLKRKVVLVVSVLVLVMEVLELVSLSVLVVEQGGANALARGAVVSVLEKPKPSSVEGEAVVNQFCCGCWWFCFS